MLIFVVRVQEFKETYIFIFCLFVSNNMCSCILIYLQFIHSISFFNIGVFRFFNHGPQDEIMVLHFQIFKKKTEGVHYEMVGKKGGDLAWFKMT